MATEAEPRTDNNLNPQEGRLPLRISHPNVLSPEEALLLAVSASVLSEEDGWRRIKLEDRLYAYAKREKAAIRSGLSSYADTQKEKP